MLPVWAVHGMDSERDDLDELLSHAQPRLPHGLDGRVHIRTRLERRAPLLAAACGGLVLSLLAIALLAMTLAHRAETGGLRALLAYVSQDWGLLRSDPGWFLATATGVVYWPAVAGIAFSLWLFLALTTMLVHAAGEAGKGEERS